MPLHSLVDSYQLIAVVDSEKTFSASEVSFIFNLSWIVCSSFEKNKAAYPS